MGAAHSKWSASSSSRNLACPGNIALLEGLPQMPSGYAAMWGTACHELCQLALTQDKPAGNFEGTHIDVEGTDFTVDSDMIECADLYLDYIRVKIEHGYELIGVEIQFDLASLGAQMQAGGTADCVLYHPGTQELEVVDLKTGKGVLVEVLNNAQARFYAIGAVTTFPKLPVKRFRSTIVQPRVAHRDGRIRSEDMSTVDMLDWATELVEGVNKAQEALDAFHAAGQRSDKLDAWTDGFLVAGEWCTYCKAAGGCPKLRKLAMEASGADMSETKPKFVSNKLSENSPAVVERDLDLIPLLEEWIAGRRALAHQMAEGGHKFDHHMLVEKIGHRKFAYNGASDPMVIANVIRSRMTITNDQLYEDPKLRSPASLERAIGKKTVADRLSDLIIKPVTGTDLVSTLGTVNTKRKPVQTTSERFFVNKEN